jgi:hypothetical protein
MYQSLAPHNIQAVIHDLFSRSFLYSYSKTTVNLIYTSAVIWLGYILLYAWRSIISSASYYAIILKKFRQFYVAYACIISS